MWAVLRGGGGGGDGGGVVIVFSEVLLLLSVAVVASVDAAVVLGPGCLASPTRTPRRYRASRRDAVVIVCSSCVHVWYGLWSPNHDVKE